MQVRFSMREILGIAEQFGEMHYLRFPISMCHLWRTDYTELETSIHSHLEGWQSRALSMMD